MYADTKKPTASQMQVALRRAKLMLEARRTQQEHTGQNTRSRAVILSSQLNPLGLANMCPKRMLPKGTDVVLTKYTLKDIPYVRGPYPRTSFTVQYTLAAFCSTFYQGQVSGGPESERYYSAYATLFSMMSDSPQDTSFKEVLNARDSVLVAEEYKDAERFAARMSELYPNLEEFWKQLEKTNINNKGCLLSIVAVLLQTLGRRVNEANVGPWFSKCLAKCWFHDWWTRIE